jgi:hypothetical protein
VEDSEIGSNRNSAVDRFQIEITAGSKQRLDKIIAIFSFALM